MRKGLLALFSGFPKHHFSQEITERLRAELTKRDSIVFITACPFDHEQNDDDCDCMYKMFTEQGLSFGEHCVIDKRTEPETAKKLVVKYCFTATEISDYKITHGYAIISDICSKGR